MPIGMHYFYTLIPLKINILYLILESHVLCLCGELCLGGSTCLGESSLVTQALFQRVAAIPCPLGMDVELQQGALLDDECHSG